MLLSSDAFLLGATDDAGDRAENRERNVRNAAGGSAARKSSGRRLTE
jgi:hypothetical protein